VRIVRTAASAALCSVALAVGSVLPAQASLAHPAVVSENPADTTPHVIFDAPSQSIDAYAQVGRTMYAGGRFTQVQDPAKTTTYARQNFVAFDSETGVVSPLDLSFNGAVTAIAAAPDGSALFISGAFSKVNGITRRGIAKYDLVNNRIDPAFAPTGMRTVSDIKLANGAVIAAGNFAKHVMAMDRRGHRRHRRHRRRGGRHERRDQGQAHRGLPRRHPAGGHGQLRHGQRPEPQARVHAEPRPDRDAEHLVRPALQRELRGGEVAGQCARRGLRSRRQLLRDRGHRRADRHQRRV
jgi:hypothetical protein